MFCSMWDFPGPGLEPVSPALAGGFLTTAPPGKPLIITLDRGICNHFGSGFDVIKFFPGLILYGKQKF